MIHKFAGTIELISPVHIGTGETYSPHSDFIIEGDKVFLINQAALGELLKKHPELLEGYIEALKKDIDGTDPKNEPAVTSLKEFFFSCGYSLSMLQKEGYVSSTPLAFGVEAHTKTLVRACEKSGEVPILPGSTIKGAIRNALFYNYLVRNKHRVLKSPAQLFIEKDEPVESVQKSIQIAEKRMSEQSVMDRNGKWQLEQHMLRFLGASDTIRDESGKATLEWHQTGRYYLNGKYPMMGAHECLALPADTALEFTLTINTELNKHNTIIEGSDDPSTMIQSLYQQVNFFSCKAMNLDLSEINAALNNELKTKPKEFDGIKQWLQNHVAGELNKLRGEGDKARYMMLRLGAGKTYYQNSMGLFLKEYYGERIIEEIRKGFKRSSEKPYFPVTRTVIAKGYQQPGWVKITLTHSKTLKQKTNERTSTHRGF